MNYDHKKFYSNGILSNLGLPGNAINLNGFDYEVPKGQGQILSNFFFRQMIRDKLEGFSVIIIFSRV